jgi:hypothetical protein
MLAILKGFRIAGHRKSNLPRIIAQQRRARRLQADATTPRVKQYLDKMIAHCERLAGKVEPRVSPSRSATIGRSGGLMIGPKVVEIDGRSY